MHDDGVRFRQRQALGRQAIALEILLRRGQQRAAHAFILQAQHDDHVHALEAFIHVGEGAHAHLLQAARQQSVRADGAHFRHAQRGQRMDVGTRHAAVQDVAHDGHRQVREILLVVADRVHVEQALGRVRVASVARVDDVDVWLLGVDQVLGDQVGRARLRVAHDEHVGMHGRQVVDGVEQGLALAGRRGLDIEVDDIGRQALRGDLEGGAGARGVFKEQIENALAAHQRHLFHIAVGNADERGSGIEDVVDDRLRQAFNRQQMLQFAVFIQLRIKHGGYLG